MVKIAESLTLFSQEAAYDPQEFVNKWRNMQLKERCIVQEHFLDLCNWLTKLYPF